MTSTYLKTHIQRWTRTTSLRKLLIKNVLLFLAIVIMLSSVFIFIYDKTENITAFSLFLFTLQFSAIPVGLYNLQRESLIIDRSLPLRAGEVYRNHLLLMVTFTLLTLVVGAALVQLVFKLVLPQYYTAIKPVQYVLIYLFAQGTQFLTKGAIWFWSSRMMALFGGILGGSIGWSLSAGIWDYQGPFIAIGAGMIFIGAILMYFGLYRGMEGRS